MLISVARAALEVRFCIFLIELFNRGECDFEVIQERIAYLRRVYNLALKDKI